VRTEDLSPQEYRALAEFRYHIRRFLQFSSDEARKHGIEPQQHQVLLAIKGLPEGRKPTIGELSERLQIQHHSAVELVNRLVENGIVEREQAEDDRRVVLIRLTSHGQTILRQLSLSHHAELETAGPVLVRVLGATIRRPRSAA